MHNTPFTPTVRTSNVDLFFQGSMIGLEALLGSIWGRVNPWVRLKDGDSGKIKVREESEVMLGLKIKNLKGGT